MKAAKESGADPFRRSITRPGFAFLVTGATPERRGAEGPPERRGAESPPERRGAEGPPERRGAAPDRPAEAPPDGPPATGDGMAADRVSAGRGTRR
jgi:hypothetical protein